MRTVQDVEAYLEILNRQFSTIPGQGGMFLIHAGSAFPKIALRVEPPLVVLRVHIGDAAGPNHEQLFRRMLELNAQALVHTSFGIEGNRIVLSSALALENLDLNELEAALDEIDLTLAEQVGKLSEISKNLPAQKSPATKA